MTPVVPPHDRPLRLSRAVFDIVLREGVGGITQSAVATEIGTSLASVRRWTPAHRLPDFGLHWIVRRQQQRRFEEVPGLFVPDSPQHRASNELMRDLVFDEERRNEELVWSILTTSFATEKWAKTAIEERRSWLRKVVASVVDGLPREAADHQRLLLIAMVNGVNVAVRDRLIEPPDSTRLVRQHLESLDQRRPRARTSAA